MAKMSILVSPERCIGCRSCQVACKEWNKLPATRTKNTGTFENPPDLSSTEFTKIRYTEVPSDDNDGRWLFVSQRCMHCDKAGCMQICPSPGALFRTPGGAVAYDKSKCIGCKLCASSCPFGTPRFDSQNKISKCHLCHDRTQAGLEPACVKACPTGGLRYGNRQDLALQASKEGYGNLYGASMLGGTAVMYAFKDAPRVYGMKENPQIPGSVVFWNGLKPLACLGLGFSVAASIIHYLAIGPHKEEDEENKNG